MGVPCPEMVGIEVGIGLGVGQGAARKSTFFAGFTAFPLAPPARWHSDDRQSPDCSASVLLTR